VVSAEDEAHRVEQEDGRFGLVRHGSSLAGSRDQRTGIRGQRSDETFPCLINHTQIDGLTGTPAHTYIITAIPWH
jgi:hypothetical protein